jgi:hypothetical protein
MSSIDRSVDLHANFRQQQDPANPLQHILFVGRIVDSYAWLNCYLVSRDFGVNLIGTDLLDTSLSPLGHKRHRLYSPNTQVLCYFLPPDRAIILGCIPQEVDSANLSSDWLVTNSGVGYRDQSGHHAALEMAGLRDFSHGRPIDVLSGETGYMNGLGVGWHLSPTALMLRAGGQAGLSLFYLDQLARLSARTLQTWTGAMEGYSGQDEGECNEIQGYTPFPWEMLGMTRHSVDASRKGDGRWEKGVKEAYYEPVREDQAGIFRLQSFRGFLGDLERVVVAVPGSSFTAPEHYGSGNKLIGLSETVRHANGALTFRSAKGVHLEKILHIPVARRKADAEDPAGDNATGEQPYSSGGRAGEGPEHNKHEFPFAGDSPAARPCQLLDMHAYLFDTYGGESFRRHRKDWDIWHASTAPTEIAGAAVDPAIYQPLGRKFAKPLPASVPITIDHRTGHRHKYYRSRASIDITDDGSIVLEDATGSQLILSGGNMYRTCQGDIIDTPGRSQITLAGRDVALRAGNCVDLSAALGSVRIKADKHVHMLAGNSGSGSVMMESRGSGSQDFSETGDAVHSSGILLKSAQAPVLVYGRSAYVRTVEGGGITLDADQGNGPLHSFSSSIFQTVRADVITAYGVGPDPQIKPTSVERHNGYSVVFGQEGEFLLNASNLVMPKPGASLYVDGSAWAKRGFVHDLVDDSVRGPWTPQVSSYVDGRIPEVGRTETLAVNLTDDVKQDLYKDEEKFGHERFIKRLGFSFRTDDQYGVEELLLYQSRWQQGFEHLKVGVKLEEPVVKNPEGTVETLPWPGKENWKSRATFVSCYGSHWDWTQGRSHDPSDAAPKAPELRKSTPADSYLVTIQR